MSYKNEIRQSEIQALMDRVASGGYNQYLRRLVLKKVRGFTDKVVTLDFPVTAIIGPNGGGKTTIMGAAGLAYAGVAPGDFFAKSGVYDASMKNWKIEYELIDRPINSRGLPVQRTASFLKLKWNRRAVPRKVLVFGVSRTIPATERPSLVKAVGNKFIAHSERDLEPAVISAVGLILGKDIAGYNQLNVDALGRVSLFAAKTAAGHEYSEFHFGAGEASIIRMVADIEAAANNTLILIEEIENGLHPVATRRMVEYLLDVAKRKSCQIIFTTHSNDALDPLPPKAIWAAYQGEVLQGKLDIKSLRTITGQVDAKLAIFAEDKFAELMVRRTLMATGSAELDAIKIHAMGGFAPAEQVNRQHNLDPTSRYPSVCVLDGDRRNFIENKQATYVLPGVGGPDAHVFDSVLDRIDTVAARLAISLQLPISEQDRVKEVVQNRALTNRDRHNIFEQIGEDLFFTAKLIVQNAFLAIWSQEYPGEVEEVVAGFRSLIPIR